MKKNNLVLTIGFIAVIVFSLLFRMHIFSPVFFNGEWNSSTVFRHMQIWDKEGISSTYWNPSVSYPGAANKYINNNASNDGGQNFLLYEDGHGSYYYTSYPQFAYIAPYLFFKLFHLNIGIIGLRLFNVLVQILTASLIYLIIMRFSKRKLAGFAGFLSYMLLPITMEYHADNYMSDMFSQLFFALCILFALRIIEDKDDRSKKVDYIVYAVSLGLFAYTDWFGFFVAGGIGLYALIHRKETYARPLIWITTLLPIAAIVFSVYQYSLIGGYRFFIEVTINRYLEAYAESSFFTQLIKLIENYYYWYKGALLFAIASWAYLYYELKITSEALLLHAKKWGTVFFLAFVPVVAHHAVFFNWTVHHSPTFSLLKSAIGISLIIAFFAMHLLEKKRFMLGSFLAVFVIINMYVYMNDPFLAPKSDVGTSYCRVGKTIAALSQSDEVIFLKDEKKPMHHFPINPVITTCAERNMEVYSDNQSAMELLKKSQSKKAVIFTLLYFDGDVVVAKVERSSF